MSANSDEYKNSDKKKISDNCRIAKFLSRIGLCSRRKAEEYIKQGRISVDNHVIDTPATFVNNDCVIKFDGKIIENISQTRLWIIHKPVNTITSNHDQQARTTIFDLLPKNMPRVITVGRLDYNTEGLLLLTNNGELSRYMELPSNGWIRRYRVRVFGELNINKLTSLKNGITIDGVKYGKIIVEYDKDKIKDALHNNNSKNNWLTVSLSEGKNREIRKIMQHFGLQVNRLIRIEFGPFKLADLKPQKIQEVDKKTLKTYFPDNIIS